MEIVESTDHFMQDVYRIEDEGRLVAICYRMKDAEVAKAAFEKAKEEADKADSWWW